MYSATPPSSIDERSSTQVAALNSSNLVKIRIWGKDIIRHVSLETENIYVSLWPNTSDGDKAATNRALANICLQGCIGSCCTLPQSHISPGAYAVSAVPAKLNSFQYDSNEVYQRPPDEIYQLELPHAKIMELSFITKMETIFRAHKISWDLFGYGQSSSEGRYFNCATLVYNLLTIGGIYEVMDTPRVPDRRIPAYLGFVFAIIGLIMLLTNHDKKPSMFITSVCLLTAGLVLSFGLVVCGLYLKCRYQSREIRETFITSPTDIAKMMKLAKAVETTNDASIMTTPFIDYANYDDKLSLPYICSIVKKFVSALLEFDALEEVSLITACQASLSIIDNMKVQNKYYISDLVSFNKFVGPILKLYNLFESMPDVVMNDYKTRFGAVTSVNSSRILAVMNFKKQIYQKFLEAGVFQILIHRYPFLRNRLHEILVPHETPLVEGQAIMFDVNAVERNAVMILLLVLLTNDTNKFRIRDSVHIPIEEQPDSANEPLLK